MTLINGILEFKSHVMLFKISPLAIISRSNFKYPPSPSSFISGAKILPISRREIFLASPLAVIFMVFIFALESRCNDAALVFKSASVILNVSAPFQLKGSLNFKGTSIIFPRGIDKTPEAPESL